MSITDTPSFTCVTCESPAGPHPTFHVGLAFCCAGCVANGPCICSYDVDALDVDAAAPSVDEPVASAA
jgi:hypothetical protein